MLREMCGVKRIELGMGIKMKLIASSNSGGNQGRSFIKFWERRLENGNSSSCDISRYEKEETNKDLEGMFV